MEIALAAKVTRALDVLVGDGRPQQRLPAGSH